MQKNDIPNINTLSGHAGTGKTLLIMDFIYHIVELEKHRIHTSKILLVVHSDALSSVLRDRFYRQVLDVKHDVTIYSRSILTDQSIQTDVNETFYNYIIIDELHRFLPSRKEWLFLQHKLLLNLHQAQALPNGKFGAWLCFDDNQKYRYYQPMKSM
jgi:superfamily II DNA or RNA helicase